MNRQGISLISKKEVCAGGRKNFSNFTRVSFKKRKLSVLASGSRKRGCLAVWPEGGYSSDKGFSISSTDIKEQK